MPVMESKDSLRLLKSSHVRYALRHLRMLPPPYQSEDGNRITLGFFALGSLAIVGGLDRLDQEERTDYIDWIYRRWDDQSGGFSGAPILDLVGIFDRSTPAPSSFLPSLFDP